MSDDLDLRGIDHRHEPDPQFRAALQRRLAAIMAGTDPGSLTEARDLPTIDLEPTSAKPAPSRNRRRAAVAVLAAAAAVAAIAVVAIRDHDATPADQPSPTVTVPPTTPPRALPTSGDLEPGTYFVDEVAGIPTPRIFATLGAGWALAPQVDGWRMNKRDDTRTIDEMARDANMTPEEMPRDAYLQHDVGVMEFSHPVAVYLDACHWEAGNHPGPLDTVDGLVAALSEQHGWAEVTVPSDISIDGYVGKAFQRTAPTDMSDCSTRNYGMRTGTPGVNSDFRSWDNPDAPAGWAGEYYEPGWIETLWVLDLDGTMVVISTGVWPEPSAGADADFAADVLDSIRIDQPSPTVTVAPTTPPRPLPKGSGIAPGTVLVPGTYFVDEVAGIPTPRIFASLGAGWFNFYDDGWHIGKSDDPRTYDEMVRDNSMTPEETFDAYLQHAVGVMDFSHPIAVYSDACHWEAGNHPGPLDTVDGLVVALSEQQGWAEVTAPSDISVDGYVGKAFQRTAPADMSDCSTRNGGMRVDGMNSDFRSWENPGEPAGWAGEYYEPGWIETLWVLDLDGTMVVISTGVWPEPSAGADADFAADVLDSIRIERA